MASSEGFGPVLGSMIIGLVAAAVLYRTTKNYIVKSRAAGARSESETSNA
jgi:hypothetical protein